MSLKKFYTSRVEGRVAEGLDRAYRTHYRLLLKQVKQGGVDKQSAITMTRPLQFLIWANKEMTVDLDL